MRTRRLRTLGSEATKGCKTLQTQVHRLAKHANMLEVSTVLASMSP